MARRDEDFEAADYPERDEPLGATPADWALLVLRSAWRRKLLVIAILLAGTAALVGYYRSCTPLYRAQAKIFAQKQDAVPSLLRSSGSNDAPTRTAWDVVHQRDNLIALVKEANLVAKPPQSWSPVSWFKRFSDASAEGESREDAIEGLVARLDRELVVSSDERTVTISIDWPDRQQAHRIVEDAVQNFVEARHVQEITAIDEVISLLQGRVSVLRGELEGALAQAQRNAAVAVADATADATARVHVARPPPGQEDLVRLKSLLESKERAVRDVEEFRRRRLADLQAQLDEKRGVYSDNYPAVVSLRQDIEALALESPQIAALRADEKKLRDEYAARLARIGASPAQGVAAPLPSGASRVRRGESAVSDEEEHVRDARFRYQQMVDRLNSAQIELDAARAAFKYRYHVIWPPDVDKRPVSPSPKKIFGVGGVATILFALLAAAALDVLKGRVIERWQIEQSLALAVIGEVER